MSKRIEELENQLQASEKRVEELTKENARLEKLLMEPHNHLNKRVEELEEENRQFKEWMKRLKKEVFEGKSKISGRLQREGESLLTKNNNG